MARRKMKTRVRSAVTTSVKSKVGLVQPRTVKSRFKADVKQLTVNQIEFLKASKNLERRVKRYAKNIGLALSPDDILGMIPDMPKRVTKQYISKLIATSAKELIELWMPELKLADPVVEKVVETVVEQAVEKTGGKVENGLYSDVDVPEPSTDYPSLTIADRILDWINNRIPDTVGYRSDDKIQWVYEDMSQHKSFLSNLVTDHYNDSDEGAAYFQYLIDNQSDLLGVIDHFPYVSTQQDYDETIGRLYDIIALGTITPYGELVRDTVNDVLSGGV